MYNSSRCKGTKFFGDRVFDIINLKSKENFVKSGKNTNFVVDLRRWLLPLNHFKT